MDVDFIAVIESVAIGVGENGIGPVGGDLKSVGQAVSVGVG